MWSPCHFGFSPSPGCPLSPADAGSQRQPSLHEVLAASGGSGILCVMGGFEGSVDFNAGGGGDVHTSNGGTDAFLVRLTRAVLAPTVTAVVPTGGSTAGGTTVTVTAAAGRATPASTDATITADTTAVAVAHIAELRAAVLATW